MVENFPHFISKEKNCADFLITVREFTMPTPKLQCARNTAKKNLKKLKNFTFAYFLFLAKHKFDTRGTEKIKIWGKFSRFAHKCSECFVSPHLTPHMLVTHTCIEICGLMLLLLCIISLENERNERIMDEEENNDECDMGKFLVCVGD